MTFNSRIIVHSNWEEATAKISNVIYLKIGNEEKKVPVMISVDGKKYLVRIMYLFLSKSK